MPINSKHPLYDANIAAWRRCRDVYAGEDAVKGEGETYLPKPAGLNAEEYKGYVCRAMFYEAVGRTIDGFVGAVARKEPTVKVPTGLQPVIDNVTLDGLTLNEMIKQLCVETILQGRLGVLVDMDEKTQRAYVTMYRVEDAINWDDEQVVLRETVYEKDEADPFKRKAVEQYRQLWLNEGVYTVTVWRKSKEEGYATEWVVHSNEVPVRRGSPIKEIPFFWLTPLGKTTRVEKPPLLGLVNLCLHHYHNSADLEHGRHFTGLPTLYVTGYVDDKTRISVGSTAAILLPDVNAKVGYVEFNGQGLASLENGIAEKEAKMAVLGASVFVAEKAGVEAAETARIRTSGETNLLSAVVTAVEEVIRSALAFAAEWMAVSGTIEVTLSRDFVDTKLDGPTLTALVGAYQAGALSLEQFLYNLQQGEMLAPETVIEEEVALIEAANRKKAEEAVRLAQQTKPKPAA